MPAHTLIDHLLVVFGLRKIMNGVALDENFLTMSFDHVVLER